MNFKYEGPDGTVFPTIIHDGGTWTANDGDVVDLEADPGHVALTPTTEPATITGARHADVEPTHSDEPVDELSATLATGGISGGPINTVHLTLVQDDILPASTTPDPDSQQE